MDFLKLGMKYEKSGSKLQRAVAKCLLESEKRKADRYEEHLNKKQIVVPDDPEVTNALLRSIQEKIEREEYIRKRKGSTENRQDISPE